MTLLNPRVALRLPTASATFVIGIAGYLGVNLSPYMIEAVSSALALDILISSWLVTATLLLTAFTGLLVAPWCAGPHRRLVARVAGVVGFLGFISAALVPALIVPGLLIGGIGAGGAVAVSGSALAAFRNPDRAAALNGIANRGVITVVLAVVPLIGLAPLEVFGALALFSLLGILVAGMLPAVPVEESRTAAAIGEAVPLAVPLTGAIPSPLQSARTRSVTLAGFTLLIVFAVWAASEDSLYAMAGVVGGDQAGLTPEALGLALSLATAGGLLGTIGLLVVGNRLGRAVPLAVLLILGGALKIALGIVTDEVAFIILFIAWNTVYAIAFMYFVATSAALDSSGRWSGPLLAVYLVGSALTPVIGAALIDAFGYAGFTLILGIASFVLAVPTFIIARLSTRRERASSEAIGVPA